MCGCSEFARLVSTFAEWRISNSCMKRGRIVRLILVIASFLWPLYAQARPTLEVQSVTNKDGSAVRVKMLTDENIGQRVVQIYFRKAGTRRMKKIATKNHSLKAQMAAGQTQIFDWDMNGINEISIVQECGAGPNCESLLFRIDPSTERLLEIFRGNTGFIELMNGYLVEYSRNNCCSWEARVHEVSPDGLHIASRPRFMVYMGAKNPTEENMQPNNRNAANCEFFTKSAADQSIRVNVPSKLKKICDFYRPSGG